MSTLQYALPHHGMTSEYQSSGVPYVSSSHNLADTDPVTFEFPYVTRHFTVFNSGSNAIRVGFTQNGVFAAESANYFILQGDAVSPRMELKCDKLIVAKDEGTAPNKVSVIAGLTNISPIRFFAMTGSEGVAGVG